jgi:hypothetical protein
MIFSLEDSYNFFNEVKKYFFVKSFKITSVVNDSLNLPHYKGSAIRGCFGVSLKKIVCLNKKSKICEDCNNRLYCPYYKIFESVYNGEIPFIGKVLTKPHPFIIEPYIDSKRIFNKNENFNFNIIIIGREFLNFLSLFVLTFIEMGDIGIGKGRKKFKLTKVESEFDSQTIFDFNKGFLPQNFFKSDFEYEELPESEIDIINLNFITPMRLVYRGKYVKDNIDFSILLRNIIRRFISLSFLYNDWVIDIPYYELIQESKKIKVKESNLLWYDWERYSKRKDERIKLGGLVGNITFYGQITPFLPFLIIGKHIHVGKNTSFGLGKYEINFNS